MIGAPEAMAFTQEPKPDGSSGTWVIAAENEKGKVGNKARSICVYAELLIVKPATEPGAKASTFAQRAVKASRSNIPAIYFAYRLRAIDTVQLDLR